eukprot:477988_1
MSDIIVQQLNDLILTLQQSLDDHDAKDDNNSDETTHLRQLKIGTRCTLCNLQNNMSSMNGKLCKIKSSYDGKQAQYTVYVYETEQTLFINPFNLQIVPKEKNKFHSKSDYDTETETDNEFEDNTCLQTQKIVNRN